MMKVSARTFVQEILPEIMPVMCTFRTSLCSARCLSSPVAYSSSACLNLHDWLSSLKGLQAHRSTACVICGAGAYC